MQGTHAFELALLPFAGRWDDGDLLDQAQAFTAPPLAQACDDPPATTRWLELPRPLTLSALKHAEERDSLIVRIVNLTDRVVAGPLELWAPPAAVHVVSLAEKRLASLPTESAAVDLAVGPKQVLTLEIVPAPSKGGAGGSRPTRR